MGEGLVAKSRCRTLVSSTVYLVAHGQAKILEAFSQHAICLRLQAGSQEASQLAAVFPFSQVPTILVLKYVQLFGGVSDDQKKKAKL